MDLNYTMRVIPNNEENPAVVDSKPYEEAEKIANDKSGESTMEGTEKAINKARRECTISDNMIKLLVMQLRAELSNYTLYNTFASYFNKIGLHKLAKYWEGRANEEDLHHKWILGYLHRCDAKFEYPEVPATNVDITDRLMPFKATVDREIETTGGINFIVNEALKEGDWATFTFLMGDSDEEGKLVKEQIEEEKISRETLKIASQDTDWLTIQDSIYTLYFELRPA